MKYSILRKITFAAIDERQKTRQSKIVNLSLQGIIILNALVIIFSTLPNLDRDFIKFLEYFEVFSIIIFTIEYIARVWTSVEKRKYRSSIKGRLLYIISPLQIIDLLAILPFYLFLNSKFAIFRVLRIFKIVRYSRALKLFAKVFYNKREELLSTFILFLMYLILTSTLMYWIEKDVQPDVFSSIPAAMWWGTSTLTTIGYGDIVPISAVGKIVGGISAILGVSMYVLFSSIIVSGFLKEWGKFKKYR